MQGVVTIVTIILNFPRATKMLDHIVDFMFTFMGNYLFVVSLVILLALTILKMNGTIFLSFQPVCPTRFEA